LELELLPSDFKLQMPRHVALLMWRIWQLPWRWFWLIYPVLSPTHTL